MSKATLGLAAFLAIGLTVALHVHVASADDPPAWGKGLKGDVGPCPPPMVLVAVTNDQQNEKDRNENGLVCINPDGVVIDDNAGKKDHVKGKKNDKPAGEDLKWGGPQGPKENKGKLKGRPSN